MTKTKADKEPMYLRLIETREGEYYHLRASVVHRKYESDSTVATFQGSWYPYGIHDEYDGPLYSGLRVNCQGDARSRTNTDRPEPVYGFSIEYRDVFSIDLRVARRMAKTLETVERKLEKLSETRGYVRNYGEYLGRIAEALGCVGMVVERSKRGHDVTGERYDWLTVGEGVNKANHLIYLWQQEGREQTAQSA